MKQKLTLWIILLLCALLLSACLDDPGCSHVSSNWIEDSGGVTRYTQCLLCNEILRSEPIPQVQCFHIFSVWLEDTAAGLRIKQCKNCNEILETQPLQTTCAHRFTQWTETPPSTPGGDIVKSKVCSACGKILETTTQPSLTPLTPCYGLTYIQNCDGAYLMCDDKTAFTGSTPTKWLLESCQEDQFFLKTPSELFILEYWYGAFQMAYDSGYTEQLWLPMQDASGKYIFAHATAPDYYLRSQPDGTLSYVHKSMADERCYWQFQTSTLTKGYPYIEVRGQQGIITLQLAPSVLDILTRGDLMRWANDLENAFNAYAQLTGWKPFAQLTVQGYALCHDWGYVHFEKPIIHANRDYLYADLEKKAQRDSDLVWGILHEMSHLFDQYKWHFDVEVLAAYKILYVLQACNVNAIPGEFDVTWDFNYNNMGNAFQQLCGRLSEDRSPEGYPPLAYPLASKLFEITKEIGWSAVEAAFRSMPAINGMSQLEIFQCFLDQLSAASGQDISARFTSKEWKVIKKHLN